MIDLEKVKIVSDNIHETILCSGLENEIIRTPIFCRLHRVSQSSLVFLTFPSNRVKRYEHSIGTMHIAGKIFYNSICNSKEDIINSFIAEIKNQINIWRKETIHSILPKELKTKTVKDILEQAKYPNCTLYNEVPRNIKDNEIYAYLVAYEAVRIAALLHDVGHLPYSHILENSLKKIYIKVKEDNNKISEDVRQNFIDIMNNFADSTDSTSSKDEIHEELGKLLVENIEQCIKDNMSLNQQSDMEYFFVIISFAFAKKILNSNFYDNNIFADLHLLISGVIDSDRLDYCTRDAYCAGINKDIFNYERFYCGYKMIKKKISDCDENNTYEHFLFAPSTKNLLMIEELLRKRYRIFSDINFHHEVHKHEIILEEIISQLGFMELENMEKVNDDDLKVLPMEVSSIWKLASGIKNGTTWLEYQLIQMDDSWLDTLLKNKFFEIYKNDYSSVKINGTDPQWNQFDELISTREHYFSLIKRSGDFQFIDEAFFNEFIKKDWCSKDIKLKIEIMKQKKEDKYGIYRKNHNNFFFNEVISQWFKTLVLTGDKIYYRAVEELLNQNNKNKKSEINDCIIRSSRFKSGLSTVKSPVFLIDNDNREIMFEELSFRKNVILEEEKVTPPFHLYYLPKYDENGMHCKVDIKSLIDELAKVLVDCLNEYDK